MEIQIGPIAVTCFFTIMLERSIENTATITMRKKGEGSGREKIPRLRY